MKTQPNSEPKPIESTPISTIKEELRASLNYATKWERAMLSDDTDEPTTLVSDGEGGYYEPEDIRLCDEQIIADATALAVAHKNVPILLESHDMLEAAMRWIPAGEDLPDQDFGRGNDGSFLTSVDCEVKNGNGQKYVAFLYEFDWILCGTEETDPIYLSNIVEWRRSVA